MDFGWLNVEIGWKMVNGQLLFLALYDNVCMYILLIVVDMVN